LYCIITSQLKIELIRIENYSSKTVDRVIIKATKLFIKFYQI